MIYSEIKNYSIKGATKGLFQGKYIFLKENVKFNKKIHNKIFIHKQRNCVSSSCGVSTTPFVSPDKSSGASGRKIAIPTRIQIVDAQLVLA